MAMSLIKPFVESCSTISRRREILYSQKEAFSASILKMVKQAIPPDVILVCTDEEFPTYKIVLSAFSSYFCNMFNGSFREASSDRIVLHSIDKRIMRIILEYIELEFKDHEVFEESLGQVAEDVLLAADMLGISNLLQLSSTVLGEKITHENYTEVWEIYNLCKSETLKDYLCESFSRHYKHFLVESTFLSFDPSLMRFAFSQWRPFVKHKWLITILLWWFKHDPNHREQYFNEFAEMLCKERLPSSYVLALEAELQRRPELLEQISTQERMAMQSAEFTAAVGDKIIADSVSMIVFRVNTVERIYFSGRTESKALPFNLPRLNQETIMCVQYKRKVYLLGMFIANAHAYFFEYDFDNNSLVRMSSGPSPALKYRDAFVVGDKIYVQAYVRYWYVNCYDFLTGKWTFDLLSVPSSRASFCPFENSFLILHPDRDDKQIQVTKFNETTSFTIPTRFHGGTYFHCNRKLWGLLDSFNEQFVYGMDKKCLKPFKTSFDRTEVFQRVLTMQHPLIVKHDKLNFTLIDLEYGVIVGKQRYPPDSMLFVPYCDDLTL